MSKSTPVFQGKESQSFCHVYVLNNEDVPSCLRQLNIILIQLISSYTHVYPLQNSPPNLIYEPEQIGICFLVLILQDPSIFNIYLNFENFVLQFKHMGLKILKIFGTSLIYHFCQKMNMPIGEFGWGKF